MEKHDLVVRNIAARVARFYHEKQPFRIYHGSTNSTRSTTFSDDCSVDTSKLDRVLSIDIDAKTCLVESNVPMDVLVRQTLPLGLMPPVVPEFPGITVGGAFSGTGGESASFRYGFFDQSVKWFEIILADGTVTTASSTQRPSLFHGAAGTFGTLGIITLLEVQLLPAKSHVELTYTPVDSFNKAQEEMRTLSQASNPVDFIDALMFSAASGVVCSGILKDLQEYTTGRHPEVVTFSKPWDQWFYIHAQTAISHGNSPGQSKKILVPTTDYFFRYDRGAFWAGRFVFEWFGVPFNRVTRYLGNWLMSTRILYHGLHASGLGALYIIQDICMPESTAGEFAKWLDTNVQIYPLWLCPIEQNQRISMNPHIPSPSQPGQTTGEPMLNIGVWGSCPRGCDRVSCNRQIEDKVQSLRGMKWLYADTYYSSHQFWSIYNHEWYNELRREYAASTLPDVFEKVRTKPTSATWCPRNIQGILQVVTGEKTLRDLWYGLWSVWPLVGVKAVASALRGEDYLKRRVD